MSQPWPISAAEVAFVGSKRKSGADDDGAEESSVKLQRVESSQQRVEQIDQEQEQEPVEFGAGSALLRAASWLQLDNVECNGKVAKLMGGHGASAHMLYVQCLCESCALNRPDQHWPADFMTLEKYCEHSTGVCLADLSDDECNTFCRSRIHALSANGAKVQLGCYLQHLALPRLHPSLPGRQLYLYWHDEPPGSKIGTWFASCIVGIDTDTAEVKVQYQDGSISSTYLGANFVHFDDNPPEKGELPQLFPQDLLDAMEEGTKRLFMHPCIVEKQDKRQPMDCDIDHPPAVQYEDEDGHHASPKFATHSPVQATSEDTTKPAAVQRDFDCKPSSPAPTLDLLRDVAAATGGLGTGSGSGDHSAMLGSYPVVAGKLPLAKSNIDEADAINNIKSMPQAVDAACDPPPGSFTSSGTCLHPAATEAAHPQAWQDSEVWKQAGDQLMDDEHEAPDSKHCTRQRGGLSAAGVPGEADTGADVPVPGLVAAGSPHNDDASQGSIASQSRVQQSLLDLNAPSSTYNNGDACPDSSAQPNSSSTPFAGSASCPIGAASARCKLVEHLMPGLPSHASTNSCVVDVDMAAPGSPKPTASAEAREGAGCKAGGEGSPPAQERNDDGDDVQSDVEDEDDMEDDDEDEDMDEDEDEVGSDCWELHGYTSNDDHHNIWTNFPTMCQEPAGEKSSPEELGLFMVMTPLEYLAYMSWASQMSSTHEEMIAPVRTRVALPNSSVSPKDSDKTAGIKPSNGRSSARPVQPLTIDDSTYSMHVRSPQAYAQPSPVGRAVARASAHTHDPEDRAARDPQAVTSGSALSNVRKEEWLSPAVTALLTALHLTPEQIYQVPSLVLPDLLEKLKNAAELYVSQQLPTGDATLHTLRTAIQRLLAAAKAAQRPSPAKAPQRGSHDGRDEGMQPIPGLPRISITFPAATSAPEVQVHPSTGTPTLQRMHKRHGSNGSPATSGDTHQQHASKVNQRGSPPQLPASSHSPPLPHRSIGNTTPDCQIVKETHNTHAGSGVDNQPQQPGVQSSRRAFPPMSRNRGGRQPSQLTTADQVGVSDARSPFSMSQTPSQSNLVRMQMLLQAQQSGALDMKRATWLAHMAQLRMSEVQAAAAAASAGMASSHHGASQHLADRDRLADRSADRNGGSGSGDRLQSQMRERLMPSSSGSLPPNHAALRHFLAQARSADHAGLLSHPGALNALRMLLPAVDAGPVGHPHGPGRLPPHSSLPMHQHQSSHHGSDYNPHMDGSNVMNGPGQHRSSPDPVRLHRSRLESASGAGNSPRRNAAMGSGRSQSGSSFFSAANASELSPGAWAARHMTRARGDGSTGYMQQPGQPGHGDSSGSAMDGQYPSIISVTRGPISGSAHSLRAPHADVAHGRMVGQHSGMPAADAMMGKQTMPPPRMGASKPASSLSELPVLPDTSDLVEIAKAVVLVLNCLDTPREVRKQVLAQLRHMSGDERIIMYVDLRDACARNDYESVCDVIKELSAGQ